MKLTPQEIFDMNPVKFAEFIAEKELAADQQMKQAIAQVEPPLPLEAGAIFPYGTNSTTVGKTRRKGWWKRWK